MSASRARKEAILFTALFAFGIVVLPAMIFAVGIFVVGPYEGEAGLASLYLSILEALSGLEPAPWILVLSPYVFLQLVRLFFALRRPAPAVRHVTK